MKGINNFFFRLDLLQKVCMILFIPLLLFNLFAHVALLYAYIFIPLLVLCLAGAIIRFPRPSDDEIIRSISDAHAAYHEQILRQYSEIKDENTILIEGFSTQNAWLKRNIDSYAVYPACRSLVFVNVNESELFLHIKDTPIMQSTAAPETKFSASIENNLTITPVKTIKRAKTILLDFSVGNESFSAYIRSRDRFKIKEIIEKSHSCITADMRKIDDFFEKI